MLVDRVVRSSCWLLIAGISYTLIGSLSYFLAPGDDDSLGAHVGGSAMGTEGADAATLELIRSKTLFGRLEPGVSEEPTTAEVTVATALPLELRGVFVTDAPGESVAILALRNHRAELYSVGEKAPGDAELVAVLADHVVLNNGGRREILRFPKPPQASRQAPGVLSDEVAMSVAMSADRYSDEPVQRVEDHPDYYEPGFSAVLGRVVEDSDTDEGG